MNQPHSLNSSARRWQLLAALLAAGLLGLTACRTAQQVSEDPEDFSGFLGDYSRLQRGEQGEANYIYIDTSVNFAKYTKVFIQPVELWKSDEPDSALGRLSPQNQQLLVDYFYTALLDALEKHFQVVNYAGPDVLVVHAAVTEARKSRPVSNLASSVVPGDMAAGFARQWITGTGAGAGLVMVETDFMDGQTGRRVAAAVDARPGTKAVRTKFNSTWGDVKLAFDWWTQRLVARMELWKQGKFSAESL
jgi:hypothetical protein